MTKRDILFLCLLVILVLSWIIPLMSEDPNTCPTPEDLESMEVYQFLSDTIQEDTSPAEAIEAFALMCEMPVDCLDDRILLEYRYSEYDSYYYIHVARQFQFSDNAEFVQLHLDLRFSSEEMQEFPRACDWFLTNRTDIRRLLTESAGFRAVDGLTPNYAGVAIDWTW